MKAKIRKKLNSRQGISMVVALIFFLLCATIGSIVVTASTVSVGKTVGDRRTQRGYLAVSSAARLVEQDFSNLSFTGAYKSVETTETTVGHTLDDTGNDIPSTTVDTKPTLYSFCADKTGFTGSRFLASSGIDLSNIYYNSLPSSDRVFPAPGGSFSAQSFSLSFPENEGMNIPAVGGSVTIDPQFRITVMLQEVTGDNTIYLNYTPTISAPVLSGETDFTDSGDVATETVTTVYTTTVTWGDPVYSGEGGGL